MPDPDPAPSATFLDCGFRRNDGALRSCPRGESHLIFDSLYMAAAQAFYFASKFKIPSYLFVIEDAEAVDDGHRIACHFDDFIGCQFQVFLVPD